MTKILTKELVHRLFPRYIDLFTELNNNVLFYKTVSKKIEGCKEFEDRTSYYKYLNENILKNQAIDYLEFGVYKGDSIADWSSINSHQESRFFGFDSFEGLPERFDKSHPKGDFNANGQIPQINDKRVKFVKGLFQKTLPEFLSEFKVKSQLVINIDCDLYSSTLYSLTQLNSIIKPDTIILFNVFGNLQHEFLAFYDYVRSYNRDFQLICRRGWSDVAIKMK